METLRKAALHLDWADTLCRQALVQAKAPPADALRLFAHVIAAELLWLDRVEGTPSPVAVWPEPHSGELDELAKAAHARLEKLVGSLRASDLNRSVAYTNSAGEHFESLLGDILLHVMLHGAYHRGQVALLLRTAGQEPAPTDYIAFVRGVPAATHPLS